MDITPAAENKAWGLTVDRTLLPPYTPAALMGGCLDLTFSR